MGPVRIPALLEAAVRWLLIPVVLTAGVLWWWAVLRLALEPADAGPVEGAVAVGGWGLGLLPVHCVPGPARGRRRPATEGASLDGASFTRASIPPRSGEGSGPS
ncbi:hypothetical protein [Streptomyces sp. A1136]|uniref:hypothetical protein n=1 Tax=Streptomyces sp. A1136 TaxID=2563102 RepID=UPI00109E88E3|nr:hypothetical protein [Streptomyces sp. A1136]THA57136.1 hypothetical protein E6R62_07440 [Streptomyces sp. A1136]